MFVNAISKFSFKEMSQLSKFLQRISVFLVTVVCIICSAVTFSEKSKDEGIFIESISEVNKGALTLDLVRTRPIEMLFAGKKIPVESDGYYISERELNESPYVARDRAKSDARRTLSEQISMHIRSISEVKKGRLTRDEIHTVSMIAMKIESETVTAENLENDSIKYHCHIKAVIDDSGFDYADKEKFLETVKKTIEIEKETARINAELNSLKQKYKNASAGERAEIDAKLKDNEKTFSTMMWKEQAYIANYQGNFDQAIEYCYKVIDIDPNSFETWNNLGYAYTYQGNLDKAVECYSRAIELNPNYATAEINIGSVYDSMKNYDKAIEHYQKALGIAPENADALNSIGYVYIQKGDFDRGIEYCQKALNFNARHAAAWNGLAYSYNQKKKFYKAIECCRKAVGLNKNYANAWNNLGYACSKLSRYEESYSAYRNAVKFAPGVSLYRANLDIAKERIYNFKSL